MLLGLVSTFVDTSIIRHKQVKVKHISQTFSIYFYVLLFGFPAYVSIIPYNLGKVNSIRKRFLFFLAVRKKLGEQF